MIYRLYSRHHENFFWNMNTYCNKNELKKLYFYDLICEWKFLKMLINIHNFQARNGGDGCKTIHHPHNVSERLGVIHISADAKFAHLKRGITGVKHAYHAFTIIFLVCQPTLRPPLTPWWYFGSDPSPLRSSADILWPLMYI